MNSSEQFEDIVSRHYEPLYRFALSLTRSESDAEDLTQHTFFAWAKKGHQLHDISKVKTWLFTTLHRAFLVARRRRGRFVHEELDAVSDQLPPVSPNFANNVDASHVLFALAKVDEVYQAAVALFYIDDHSYAEIAAILEVPVGTVKSRIARGVAQLRVIMLSGEHHALTPLPRGDSSIAVANETPVRLQSPDAVTTTGTVVPLSPGNCSAFNES